MKIVFVQPLTGFKGHTWEALNIGYLSSYLEKYYSSDLDIEFYSGFYDSDETILHACEDADIIGMSCTSPQFRHGVELANQIKNKDNLIVFGGVHASALPDLVAQEPSIDVVVVGEGEKAMLQIVNDFNEGKKTPSKLLHFDFVEDLDTIPFPDRTVIKNERHIQQAYKDNGVRITSVLTSRGCPFRCAFCCSETIWHRKTRIRSVGNVLQEIEELVKDWNIQFLKFSDDTFTLNKKWIAEFSRRKIEIGLNLPYGSNAHVNTIDENMLKHLADSNCTELWYGVESGSSKILKDMRKSINVERIKKVFKLTKDYGIKTRAYFLLGMPNETIEDIRLTEKLCDEIEPDVVGFSLLAPFPDNEFYDYETMKDWDWSMFDEYSNDWVQTKTLTNQQLKDEQKRLVEKYQRKITFRQKQEK
ncbi:MAG: B12-binding domain-containing radical SAM protein [Candidatus Thorarchaeota archaeon]|nr:B12-binding domain-containing radical SAM protein [Candidatus Thorarchaeota archaeon]